MPISRYRSTVAKRSLTSFRNTTKCWCTAAVSFYRTAIAERTALTSVSVSPTMSISRYRSTSAKLSLTSFRNTTKCWCTAAVSFYRTAIAERTALTSVSVSPTMSISRYRSTSAKLSLTSFRNTTKCWCTAAVSFYRTTITKSTSLTSVSVSCTMPIC